MKKQLLILMTLFISVIGYSQTFVDNNITYVVTSTSANTVEVTDYDFVNGGTAANIPATVVYNSGTYNVTSIGNSAFTGNTSTGEQISSVIIPNGVTNIGVGAFSYNLLSSISIPNTVTNISNIAFFSNNLASVTIPNSVTMIGSSVFLNNPLTCVVSEGTIPATIVTPTGSNPTTDSFSTNRGNIDLSIPAGTASAYASTGWTGFNSVAQGLTGTFVIDHITYQIDATPNNEVTIIDYDTVGGTVVDIPAMVNSGCIDFSVTSIGQTAFFNKGLTSVDIPDSVTSIGEESFASNVISNLTLPDNLTSIGIEAFATNLITSVTIPTGVINIEAAAFFENAITTVSIPNTVTNIGAGAFRENQIASITLPADLTNIGNFSFRDNLLTDIIIPENVTNIGIGAFDENPLTSVTSLNIIPPIIITGGTNDSFSTDRSNIALHIPANTLDIYVTNPNAGADWSGFNPVTEDALSVSEFELSNDIKVITTTDAIQLISSDSVRLENYALYSISGAKVAKGIENEIPTSYLTSGIYILKLDFNKGTVVKKVAIN